MAQCHTRRLRKLAAAAPLPSVAVVLAGILAPIGLVRVGRAVGSELSGAVDAAGVSEALVLGPVLAAAVAGVALAVSYSGRSSLGPQVAAGPCGDNAAVVAGLLVPGALAALVVLPSLVAGCVALAGELPGGSIAGVVLAVAILAAIPAGAVAAEGVIAALRGRRRRAAAIGAGAFVWGPAGLALGAGPLGPLARVTTALQGAEPPWLALTLSSLTAITLGLVWVRLAATRAEPRPRALQPRRRVAPGGHAPVLAAVAALLTRRSDVRLATVGAIGFGAAGIGVAAAAAAPAPSAFLLATTTALLGSTLVALVACGALLEGGWLWRSAASDRRVVARSAALLGLAGSALPVAVVGACAAVVSGVSWDAAGVVAAFVVAASAAALVAGTVVPWRGGIGDQLATFAAFAAIAITASLLVGVGAPRLVSFGVPDVVVAALVCGGSITMAVHALGRRLGVATR